MSRSGRLHDVGPAGGDALALGQRRRGRTYLGGHHDPLWPLDALFGANDDVTEAGPGTVRDVATTHYRLTVDLVAADEHLPAGISMPEGPFRRMRRLPAEVWLADAGLSRSRATCSGSSWETAERSFPCEAALKRS
ncbi:hypothetical protein [Jiangella sp. DSM 45060]|uniref:hypothetical protein n=1 Tax=Jiangella sp. DSM 45060 TaxID=1798224 RepID=UPI0008798DC3|nr:hypothetical protein [Jiangella sp. DSM 45060]SDT61767.1 hypothetical protein SAMN04515669_5147 [Jiangella sp. DSM 45060]